MNDLERFFTYTAPTTEQQLRCAQIRLAGKELARLIYEFTIDGGDRAAAIRHVRDAVYTANAAITVPGAE